MSKPYDIFIIMIRIEHIIIAVNNNIFKIMLRIACWIDGWEHDWFVDGFILYIYCSNTSEQTIFNLFPDRIVCVFLSLCLSLAFPYYSHYERGKYLQIVKNNNNIHTLLCCWFVRFFPVKSHFEMRRMYC